MSRFASMLAAFRRKQDGGMIELSAIFLLVAAIMLGFVIDTGSAYYTKVKLTKITAAAATGGVLSAPNASNMLSTALNIAAKNTPAGYGVVTNTNDIVAGFYDTSTKIFTANAQPLNALKVVASRASDHSNPLITFFGNLLGRASFDVRATSYAMRFGGVCLYVLGTNSTSLATNGNPVLNTPNCPMQINGSASINSNTTIKDLAACLGGTTTNSGVFSTPPQQNCGTLPDPLANVLQPPSASQCDYTNAPLSGTLSPGLYCYTNTGSVGINGNKSVSGTGVTLYFDAKSYLSIGGGASLSIIAPKSGVYSGIAIFQSRTPTSSANTFSLGGGGTFNINGALYIPDANLNLNGSSGGASNFSQVITYNLSLGGAATYSLNSFGSNQINPSSLIAHASQFIPNL